MPRGKALTVRLPLDLYESSSALARHRRVSLNTLIQEGLAALLREEEQARLYAAFGELGEEMQEADVEFAVPAQWEVVRRDGESRNHPFTGS
jgi:hypothetical protein